MRTEFLRGTFWRQVVFMTGKLDLRETDCENGNGYGLRQLILGSFNDTSSTA
jgi:hypothetical protein